MLAVAWYIRTSCLYSESKPHATRPPPRWSSATATGPGKILSNIVLSQISEHAAVRRRGAGDRRARPCRGAGPHHRQGDDGGRQDLRRDRRHCRRRRPGPDRRRDRRPDHRQGDRAGQRQAADGDQPSRSPCADRAADGGNTVPLLPVPRLRRPHPDPGGARRRRLRAARHHLGRRHRRGLRQDREAAGPRLSRRPAGREGGGARQRRRGSPCRGRCRAAPSRISRCRD